MAQEGKNNKKVRVVLWAIAAVMSVFSLILFFFNYQTLEKATLFSEKRAVAESKNFRHYVQEYKTTKVALDDANQKLVALTQELEQANVDLSTARGELSSVQQINDQFKASIAVLERYKAKALAKGDALEEMIISFKKKNKELDVQLQGVRKELAVFQPDINDVNEGRSKVQLFKQHIHLVKKNMALLREKAQEVKLEAQKERDRLESIYGNNGFMVKNGEDKSVTKFDEKRIEINVKFINQ